jgi:drug/metabolite transporter (DMT)-like permease
MAIVFMLINVVTWGAALPIVKPALDVVTPYQFLFWRYVFAVIFSLPILFYFPHRISGLVKTILIICALEIVGTTLALSLLYEGLSRTSSIEASLIATTAPIFITFAGILILKEKEERHEWLGLGVAFLGTLLLTVYPMLNAGGQIQFSNTGNLLVVAQNVVAALYFVFAKKYYTKLPKMFVTTISFYVGMLTFGAIVWLSGPNIVTPFITTFFNPFADIRVLIATLYMAVFGSIIGLTAYIKGQDGMEASEAGLFTYLQPLVFLPIGIVFLKEGVTPVTVLALFMILGGVFFAEYRKRRY